MVLALRVAKTLARSSFRSAAARPAWFSTFYTKQHEYIKVDGKTGTVGITDFAQNSLGDVVYVDLPSVGDSFAKGEAFGAVESVKAASDVYLPASGKIIATNEDLSENPSLVNEEAMTSGWFVKIEIDNASDLDDLLNEEAYKELCDNEEHH